jgi:hypothetical protein
MQFKVFFFFFLPWNSTTYTNTSTISIQSIKRKFLPFYM